MKVNYSTVIEIQLIANCYPLVQQHSSQGTLSLQMRKLDSFRENTLQLIRSRLSLDEKPTFITCAHYTDHPTTHTG